jgi:hypothetical protein
MYKSKEEFKPGELIVCVDVSNKPYRGYKKPDIKTITKNNSYIVQEKDNPYNDLVFVINDLGERKSYSTRRFIRSRGPKIRKIIKRISS